MQCVKTMPSPRSVRPKLMNPGEFFRTRLMKPAIASDPYCAEAPSRSTSIRSIAPMEMAFMSVPAVPPPTESRTWSRALLCCFVPLTSAQI